METCKTVKGIVVYAAGDFDDKELEGYVDYAVEREGDNLTGIAVKICEDNPEEVELTYHVKKVVPFERVRRITGYLVGTVDRWNDAKRAEERDRVKHGV